MKAALRADVIKSLTRDGLRPTTVWPTILRKVDASHESTKKAQLAKDALELFLLTEPANVSVERDANIARLILDATGNIAESDLLDSRVRMGVEGPDVCQAISTSKGQIVWRQLLHKAAKDFLVDRRLLNATSAGKRLEPCTTEH